MIDRLIEKNKGTSANDEVKTIIETIKDLNKKLEAKKDELEQVREEYARETGKPAEDIDVTVDETEAKG